MKVSVKVDGDLRAIYGTSLAEGKRAVQRGVSIAGGDVQGDWRGQIAGAGLGSRLQRTIRKKVYPEGRNSLRAAALVWSNAGKIVDAFERGVTIRSENGFYLAIPLPAAGTQVGGKRITPGLWEKKTGRRLQFVFRKGKPPLLVDTGTVTRAAPRVAFGERQRERRGFKNRSIPIFVLKPSVKLPKKLSLMATANAAQARLPELIVANWQEGRTQ
ncbi:minor tail protein [Rhodobacter phage RcMeacham]|nr:minor tail protein [Rhodobacter phage RcBaka]QXN70999.1 minor tail protein [Rhodobacter phage RcDormio]QXN71210.1 minor tail protein [Rhodobacter phage RcFrancesLouise]QXN71442.1 minor tail protein [Rhodobacter phage RcHotPocket]UUV44152.1 minor tail protein [Rhodobacter phage RcMamaDuck]UUV44315.1 minor tail protein [Rhodobacter phage RcMeacham]